VSYSEKQKKRSETPIKAASLKRRTAFLEALINTSKDAILVVDEKGRTVLRNSVEIVHIPPDVIDDQDIRKEREYLKGMAKDPERYVEAIEYLHAHPGQSLIDEVEFVDGSVVERYSSPVLGEDGTYYGRIWMIRDVTGKRRAAEALMRSQERYRVLFDSVGDALFVHGIDADGKAGLFVEVNEAACTRLGYNREELLTMGPADVNTPEGIKAVAAMHASLLKEKHMLREGTHVTKDGREIPVEVHTHLFELQGKQVVLAVVRDITERKNLEAQLLQARKMEAIGTLAGGVAHDFNNRLSVIMGFGKLVQTGMGEDDPLRAYVDDMVRSAEKAATLTRSLLAFSRKQRIILQAQDVNDVIRAAVKLLERLVSEDVVIRLDLADEKLVAPLDEALLDQVLMNLASNARDAMPTGGSLIIKTEKAVLDDKFREAHGFGQPGVYALISVSDSGFGMDASTMERIFDPFFSTKGVGKGTGLGLASVYGTVKQHKGYVTVSSLIQQGTTFRIYLPLVEASRPTEEDK
jgi:two-component system cell cycle sensor histidine kinase/response regulator CckA